jgi:ADP-heptose:LPS heptosyltransferase
MASNAFAVDPQERRIAVLVDREGLGDCLLKIPFLRAVRRAFPAHRVWWIATHQTAMEDDLAPWIAPLIDRVISHAGLTSPDREVIPRLKRLPPFDLVFDARSRFMTVLLARTCLKHRGFYACLPGFMLSDAFPPGRVTRPNGIAARMLTMVEAATGRAADWKGTFDVSAAAQRLAAERTWRWRRRWRGRAMRRRS